MKFRGYASALAIAALISAAPVAAQTAGPAPAPQSEHVDADSELRGGWLLYGIIGVAVVAAILLLVLDDDTNAEPLEPISA